MTKFNSKSDKLSALKIAIMCLAMICIGLSSSAQKFAILTDVHVDPGNANESKLREAVAEINKTEGIDAVLMTGDLTNDGSDAALKNVKSILDGITKPLYVIPGNHENNWSQSACRTFVNLWGSDRFVFAVGRLLVVGLNCGPFMKMGDGHIKQEDLYWLDNTIKTHLKPGMRVLSINHYPLLNDLDNYTDYVRILQQYPVVTHQCGHYHQWKRYQTGGIDGYVARALALDNTFGYTIMNVAKDSITVYEKLLGANPTVKYAYPINLQFTPVEEPIKDFPAPVGYDVTQVYADSASIFTRLGVDKDCVYFGNSLGVFKAINKKNGNVKWEFASKGMQFARPAVTDKYVILPTSDRQLIWLNKKNGQVEFIHYDKGPYVADGIIRNGILYQGGYKTMQAWDVNKKTLLWHYDDMTNYCQASSALDVNDLAFGNWDTNLRMIDAQTGNLKWRWNNGSPVVQFSPGNVVPAIVGDRVIVVAPDRYMTALDRKTGNVIWRWHDPSIRVRESMGVSHDGKRVYAKTMDGTVIAVDPHQDQFKLLWNVDAQFGYDHAPCIVLEHNGLVYVGSRHGEVAAIDPSTQSIAWRYQMGQSEVNGFEVDDKGDIWVSLIEGSIWRIHKE